MASSARRRWFVATLLGGVLAVSATKGWASDPVPQPDASVGEALRNIASRAAVSFVGRVTRVERRSGVVLVHFAVEQAVQGAVGDTYVLREWAGLWPPGQVRYIAGQHVLIFLNGTSSAGVSTPVDGMEGVVPVLVQGASAPQLADVRRLETRVLRAVGQPLSGPDRAAILLSDAVATAAAWKRPLRHEPARVPLPAAYVPAQKVAWRGTELPANGSSARPVSGQAVSGSEPVALLPYDPTAAGANASQLQSPLAVRGRRAAR